MSDNLTINLKGLSTFALFAIPAVLGLAALYWLAFGKGVHYFRRELSQEVRHNEVVGAKILPKEAIDIQFAGQRDDAIKITRAEIDGKDVWVWYQNVGQSRLQFIEFHWSLVSPDGTVIKQAWNYANVFDGAQDLDPGEKGEVHFPIASDPRAKTLKLRMTP
jgi:hypothetical protein